MRILYFIPSYAPGLLGNRIHSEVIEAWQAQGVEAEVLTLTTGLRQVVTEELEGVTVHRLPINQSFLEKMCNRAVQPLLHYPYWLGALAHYRRFIRREGPRFDLVHVETAFPLAALGSLVSIPEQPLLAVTLQGADVMAEAAYDYGFARYTIIRALLRRVFRQAVVLRADSPMIERLVVGMGASALKTITIPFNITNADFPPTDVPLPTLRHGARAEVCAQHGLNVDKPLLMSISRLHPFKGIEFLIEALPALQEAVGPVQVVIGGPSRTTRRFGDYATYLKQRAHTLGVQTATHVIGRVEHQLIQRYWAAADVVVVPSVAESLNRVGAEAGAVGTPTIVTRTTGISEYVTAYDCGQVVEPLSGNAIAASAIRLLSDSALWQRQSAHGPALAAQFRSSAIAQQLLDAYQVAIRNQSATTSYNKP